MTPAIQRYKAHSSAVNKHEVISLTGRDAWRNTRRDTGTSHREAMSEVPPVLLQSSPLRVILAAGN